MDRRTAAPTLSVADITYTFKHKRARWIVPTLVVGALAVVFGLVRQRPWEASQAMVVREEVTTDTLRQPTSTRADDTKAAQESIMELTFSSSVLRKSLEAVGPGANDERVNFPTAKSIEQLAESLKLVPPKGGEFGKTDFFYLKTTSPDRERALALANEVSHQVQASFEDLRMTKLKSKIQELEKTVELAKGELSDATTKLTGLESSVGGADLAELRILNEMPAGNSDIRSEATTLENELRKERVEQQTQLQLFEVLKAAQTNPGELLVCPNSLLTSQPSLKKLKDGLLDAQIRTATLLGSMSEEHPLVRAARQSEQQMGENLHKELKIAMQGVKADLKFSDERIDELESQKGKLRDRLDRLVDVRARYGNLVTTVRQRSEVVKAAETELAEARAKFAAAQEGTLLQLIGEPVTGSRPIGPGRVSIVLGGLLGGFMLGLGLVVLSAQPQAKPVQQVVLPQSIPVVAPTETIPTTTPTVVVTPTVAPVATEAPAERELVAAAVVEPTETFSAATGDTLSFNQALDRLARLKRPVVNR